MSFKDDKTSIIGCAFAYPNHYVEWDANDPEHVHVWDYSHNEVKNSGCRMWARDNKPIPFIVCASYNPLFSDSASIDPAHTVGICAFTGSNNHHLVTKDDIDFSGIDLLGKRTKEFFDRSYPLIKNQQLTPLIKRL